MAKRSTRRLGSARTHGALLRVLFGALTVAPLTAQANVLVLIADDLGTDAVGCYGLGTAPPTPQIDALAVQGIRFTAAHTSPACSPTRAELLTGRHGFRTGVAGALGGGDPGIDPSETLLPTALANSTHATALIGKWHLGVRYGNLTPNTLGWPYFVGAIDAGLADYRNWSKVRNGAVSTSTTYATTDEVNEALGWIRAQSTPWLLVVAFHAPHQPFHSPPANLHTQNLVGLDPVATPRPFFLAMVQAMDTEIGRLLNGLGSQRATTNVVFLGDNGTDSAVVPPSIAPQHAKGSLYQGGTHVPLIIAGPAVVSPGRVSNALVHAVDVFPTLLQLCNTPLPSTSAPRPLDGHSLMPLLTNSAATIQSQVYVEIRGTPFGGGYAVKNGHYELLRFLQTVPQHQELYDLVADPGEHNNLLAGTPTAATQVLQQQLETQLAAVRTDGWVEGYGAGCPGSAGTPTLRAQTMPRIGDWLYLQVENAALQTTFAFVAYGDSRSQIGGIPLPVELTPLGMPGCVLLQNYQSAIAVSSATGYGREWIVASPALLGREFFAQAVVGEPGANPAGLIGSRGLRCVIGS